MQRTEVDRTRLIYVQWTLECQSIDMLLTEKEIKRAMTRSSDPKNSLLVTPKYCEPKLIQEAPRKCTFWRWLFREC